MAIATLGSFADFNTPAIGLDYRLTRFTALFVKMMVIRVKIRRDMTLQAKLVAFK